MEKPTLMPNPAWKVPRAAARTLTDAERADLRDLSFHARKAYARQRAAGHGHAAALTLAKGQSLTDASVPRSRLSLPESLERQAVRATGGADILANSYRPAYVSQELGRARQRLNAVRTTHLASEPTRGATWQANIAAHRRRVAALEGMLSSENPNAGTAELTDNPKLMSLARLRAHVIALEGSTNPEDVRRLKVLRRAAEQRGINVG